MVRVENFNPAGTDLHVTIHNFPRVDDSMVNSSLDDIRATFKGHYSPTNLLPHIDLISDPLDRPFLQERPSHGFVDWLTHPLGRENLHQELEGKVVDRLPPQERAKYDAEEKAMQDYNAAVVHAGMMHHLGHREWPMPPATPEHERVEAKVHRVEEQLKSLALAAMSPGERQELQREIKTRNEGTYVHDPAQPRDWENRVYLPRHEERFGPEPALKHYEELLARAVEKY